MGVSGVDDNTVVIRRGHRHDEASIITINCPNQLGLASDLARILYEFGLSVIKGDLSKDGQWCLCIFWVVPYKKEANSVKWAMLENRLAAACPSVLSHLLMPLVSQPKHEQKVYVLQIQSIDHIGLLNEVIGALWELELVVHRMKATTSPDERAVNLFYLTDIRDELSAKNRQQDVYDRLESVLGGNGSSCKILPAGHEWGGLEYLPFSSLPPYVSSNLLRWKHSDPETDTRTPNGFEDRHSKITITVDNSLSPVHTLMTVSCRDRRGLLYDCMRTLKDSKIQVVFSRFTTHTKGIVEIDLFIIQAGKKILDPGKQQQLCCRLKSEILQPIQVMAGKRGPDTELLIAAPMELNGYGRPRLLYDVTSVFKKLNVGIFKANLERYQIEDQQWEIYNFLLSEKPELGPITDEFTGQIIEKLRHLLLG